MEKRLSDNIKIFSFVMTCFIVFYHLGTFDSTRAIGLFDQRFNNLFNYISSAMAVLAMSYFFAVTGFLLFYKLTFRNYFVKIKRRVFSLLVPYIAWQIIIYLMDICQGQATFSIPIFLRQTFLFAAWPFDGALWYVYAIFCLALLSPVLLFLFKNKRVAWIIVVGVFLLLALQKKVDVHMIRLVFDYGYIPNILDYLPAYLGGAFLGKFYQKGSSLMDIRYPLSLIFVAFLLEGTFQGLFPSTVIRMMPIIALLVFPECSVLNNKRIYNLSFLIYALHQPLIGDVRWIVDSIFVSYRIPISIINVAERLIILGCSVLLALFIYVVMKKIWPRGLAFLTGGRGSI